MANISDSLTNIGKINIPDYMSSFKMPEIKVPDIEPIDWNETIFGEIKVKIEDQNNLFNQEISILLQQNALLSNNYDKLKELYDSQVKERRESNLELERCRKYNRWMMVIAIVAMLAAIASPIVTILVS